MLLTTEQRAQLLENGRRRARVMGTKNEIDFEPVVCLHIPGRQCVWLLASIYPNMPDIAFCLADLGIGCPELGDVSLTELEQLGAVQQDQTFEPVMTLMGYAKAASRAGRIVA